MHILEFLTDSILAKFSLDANSIVALPYRGRDEILMYDLIYAIIAYPESVEEASTLLNSSKTYVLAYIKQAIKSKPTIGKWSNYLLKEVGYKYCNTCNTYQTLNSFSNDGSRKVSKCKECMAEYQEEYHNLHPDARNIYYNKNKSRILDRVKHYNNINSEKYSTYLKDYYLNNKDSGVYREYAAKRRARKLHATSSWANLDIIKEIYANAEGMHVDHIIPLQGNLVCGLHVENNLQYLTPEENLQKSNKFIVE